jgi:hypothetical protein
VKSHHATIFSIEKTSPSEKQLFTPGWPPEVFPAVRRGPWPAPRHAAADPSVGTLLVPPWVQRFHPHGCGNSLGLFIVCSRCGEHLEIILR